MTSRLPRSKDFWAGATFVLAALLAIYFGWDLSLGSARRMGPGYFPMMVAGLLLLTGVVVAVQGLSREAETVEKGALRPALVLFAVMLFALLLPTFGLVVAVAAMAIAASVASPSVRPTETVLLAAGLSIFAVAVFIWAVGLPMKAWPI